MWYSSGTVSVQNGSPTVVGDGTSFLSNVRVGDGIAIEGSLALHEVINVASEVGITIKPAYEGVSSVGMRFTVVPVLGYDKDLSDAFNRIRLEMGAKVQGLQPWAYASTAAEARDEMGLGSGATGDVVQGSGDSQTDVMSQKATTDALNTKADTSSLGTAATRDVATNAQALAGTAGVLPDAAGVHVAFKQYGYGGQSPTNNTLNCNALPAGSRASWSDDMTESAAVSLNLPALGGGSSAPRSWHVECFGISSTRLVQKATEVYGIGTKRGRTFIRVKHDATWHPWVEIQTTGNILSTTGQSTEYPMTQKAVTDAINGVSDRRDKLDIAPNDIGLNLIEKLEPVSFKLNKRDWYRKQAATTVETSVDDEGVQTQTERVDSEVLSNPLTDYDNNDGSLARDDRYAGLIAQDVKAALEGLGLGDLAIIKNYSDEYEGGDDRHYIEYNGLIPIMINAIKELNEKVRVLEERHDS